MFGYPNVGLATYEAVTYIFYDANGQVFTQIGATIHSFCAHTGQPMGRRGCQKAPVSRPGAGCVALHGSPFDGTRLPPSARGHGHSLCVWAADAQAGPPPALAANYTSWQVSPPAGQQTRHTLLTLHQRWHRNRHAIFRAVVILLMNKTCVPILEGSAQVTMSPCNPIPSLQCAPYLGPGGCCGSPGNSTPDSTCSACCAAAAVDHEPARTCASFRSPGCTAAGMAAAAELRTGSPHPTGAVPCAGGYISVWTGRNYAYDFSYENVTDVSMQGHVVHTTRGSLGPAPVVFKAPAAARCKSNLPRLPLCLVPQFLWGSLQATTLLTLAHSSPSQCELGVVDRKAGNWTFVTTPVSQAGAGCAG